jgi:drug/metabolite transporter (DMT)-like permease
MNETQPGPITRRRQAATMLLLAAMCWGLSFPLVKSLALVHGALAPEVPGWFLTLSTIWPRFALAGLVLAPFVVRGAGGWTHAEVAQGIGIGLFSAAGLALQVDGLRFVPASVSAFLSQFYVLLLPVVLFVRERRRPTTRFVGATAAVMVGVAILADVDWRTLHIGRGELETLLATVFFTGQILWLGRRRYHHNRAMPVTWIMFAVVAVVFGLAALALGPSPGAVVQPWTSPAWLTFTGLLAAVCTVGAFTLMNTWQRWLNAAEAGLIYATEPVFTSLLALFVPVWFAALGDIAYANEVVTWRLLTGGILITGATIVIQRSSPAEGGAETTIHAAVDE